MAEYSALLAGVVGLRHWCPSSVVIEGDSALVISQVLGRARCPDDRLRPFRTHILRHLQALRERNVAYTFRHIERNINTVADDLATTAAILRLSECRCFCSFPSSACAPRVLDSPFAAIPNTDTVWSLRHERFCPRTSVESILQPCPPVIEPRVVAAAAPATSALPLSSTAADVPSAVDIASGVPAVDVVPSEDMDVAQAPPVAPPLALQPLAADESTDMDTSVAAEVAQDLFRRRRRAQLPRNIPDDIFATVSDSLQLQPITTRLAASRSDGVAQNVTTNSTGACFATLSNKLLHKSHYTLDMRYSGRTWAMVVGHRSNNNTLFGNVVGPNLFDNLFTPAQQTSDVSLDILHTREAKVGMEPENVKSLLFCQGTWSLQLDEISDDIKLGLDHGKLATGLFLWMDS
ncbi:hypothetical protein H310_06013 [Aphanomyces invadans]|uniref:RNase H type-1 domain-containing protein n=1 Tax=Aphanomyces invadans TaxID=157072 RepID=A0A024U9G1_9STRA|nr:hypothetical protein H310_06013 [Aphanomyces invadans]ETW02517.1 hypothetical protein H310_06013 [Aphanomyces invadans]|eukprot:XP_008869122.1 hypothetical protein H310_06013 [Aphanomyces invadans]